MNNKSYQSDSYDRQAQRYVIPLYIRDELGSFHYSSTGTLVKYNGHHYIIFAAHALAGNIDFENIYNFDKEGKFYKVKEYAIGHQIFKDDDIVIVDYFNQVLDKKNYFNLNINSLLGFERKLFAWTGFPSSKSKSKKIHKTKSPEALKNQYVHTDENEGYFTNVSYLTIISKLKSCNKIQITGEYDRKNTSLKYKGKVSTAPHPQGMSGGAMYFFAKKQELKNSLDETFRFAGIGIEYKNNGKIIGVSKDKIIKLIEIFDKENPLTLHLENDFEPDIDTPKGW